MQYAPVYWLTTNRQSCPIISEATLENIIECVAWSQRNNMATRNYYGITHITQCILDGVLYLSTEQNNDVLCGRSFDVSSNLQCTHKWKFMMLITFLSNASLCKHNGLGSDDVSTQWTTYVMKHPYCIPNVPNDVTSVWIDRNVDINGIAYLEGILPKEAYPPCLRMADRVLLAGYHRLAMGFPWRGCCLILALSQLQYTYTWKVCFIVKPITHYVNDMTTFRWENLLSFHTQNSLESGLRHQNH